MAAADAGFGAALLRFAASPPASPRKEHRALASPSPGGATRWPAAVAGAAELTARPHDAPPPPPAEWRVPHSVVYGEKRNSLMSTLRASSAAPTAATTALSESQRSRPVRTAPAAEAIGTAAVAAAPGAGLAVGAPVEVLVGAQKGRLGVIEQWPAETDAVVAGFPCRARDA